MRKQISAELSILAQQRASGALEIIGNPGGMVFLSGGYLTYAESPSIPDLRTRLIRSQRITVDRWNDIIASDQDHGGVGALLVSGDVISRGELRDLLWSVALDALVALTLPGPTGSQVRVRFWPRRSHWVGSLLRLDVASVWADVRRKTERLARREIPAEGCPQLHRMTRPWAVVRSEQWAIAWQLDGLATVRDLAWRNGYALYDTLELVGDLVQAGLCTVSPPVAVAVPVTALPAPTELPPATEPSPTELSPATELPSVPEPPVTADAPVMAGTPAAAAPVPVPAPASPAEAPPPDADWPLLPQRKPGDSLTDRSDEDEIPAVPLWRPEDIPTPAGTSHPDLLRRILKSLKRDELMRVPGPAAAGPALQVPVQGAPERLRVGPPGELGGIGGYPHDHVPHLVVQHADVELVVTKHGHYGVASGRVDHQVAGAAAGHRLAEPAPAGRLGGLAGQAEGRRHDGRDPGWLYVGDVVRDQQPVAGGDQAAVDADHVVAQRSQFGEDEFLDRDLPSERLVHFFPPCDVRPAPG
jgi:hypothetical protein